MGEGRRNYPAPHLVPGVLSSLPISVYLQAIHPNSPKQLPREPMSPKHMPQSSFRVTNPKWGLCCPRNRVQAVWAENPVILIPRVWSRGPPWWSSGKASSCQCLRGGAGVAWTPRSTWCSCANRNELCENRCRSAEGTPGPPVRGRGRLAWSLGAPSSFGPVCILNQAVQVKVRTETKS